MGSFDGLVDGDQPHDPIKIEKHSDNSTTKFFNNHIIKEDAENQRIVQYIRTTAGRIIFNKIIQESLVA